MKRPGAGWGLVIVVALSPGCSPGHHGRLLDEIEAEQGAPVEIEGVERWLDGIRSAPHGQGDLQVRTRSDRLVQFPCSRCHLPGERMSGDGDSPLPDRAHWQILQPHGAATSLACQSCHSPEDPASLRTAEAEPVDFDQSYELCATCHFEQRRDWEAGVHGKRLATWSGPRVIESCAGCHDPHAPAFETRLPTTVFGGGLKGEGP